MQPSKDQINDATFTVIGVNGFIGKAIFTKLKDLGFAVFGYDRADCDTFDVVSQPIGHVIYAAGVTADFRSRPHDTMEAHVSSATSLLRNTRFESFLYLSSTRLYRNASSTTERAKFLMDPNCPESIYDLSKLAGESLAIADRRSSVRVARLSNVYGNADASDVFIASVLRDACRKGEVVLNSRPESAKDFISLADVTSLLPAIAMHGTRKVYNVARGKNTRFDHILEELRRITGCRYSFSEKALTDKPSIDREIDVAQLEAEFPLLKRDLLQDIGYLVNEEMKI
ncbi:MAG: SDR family oxidoreductase [Paracoccaceae bacterium]